MSPAPPPRIYCYAFTSDGKILQRLDRLRLWDRGRGLDPGRDGRFLSTEPGDDALFIGLINDLGDWTVPRFARRNGPLALAGDSLLSCARVEEGLFGCCTDYWGIRSHYWHHSDGTFICSNNPLLVAHLTNAGLDDRGLDEYLFFLSPREDRTLFAGIRSLQPGQELRFHVGEGRVELSGALEPSSLLQDGDHARGDFVDEFLAFFRRARERLPSGGAAVALSSGTDSTCVLAGLRHTGTEAMACSFGMPHYFEARMSQGLARRLGMRMTLVPLLTEEEWRGRLLGASFWAGGALNPLRVHYQKLYDAVPSDTAFFEGTLGSQFVKGDFPVGSAVSDCHAHLLRGMGDVRDAMDRHLGALPDDLRARISRTIADSAPGILECVRTEAGSRRFRRYALDNLPQRMFGGPLLLGADRVPLYLPYLHRGFLASLFRADTPGFARLTALVDTVHLAGKMRPQSTIVARADATIDRWILGKGLSFRETRLLPADACRYLQALRLRYYRGLRHRDAFFGQIDNSVALTATAAYLEDREAPWGPWEPGKASPRLQMCACNLLVIEDVLRSLADGWRPWADSWQPPSELEIDEFLHAEIAE